MRKMKWCNQCGKLKDHWCRTSKNCKDCVEINRAKLRQNLKGKKHTGLSQFLKAAGCKTYKEYLELINS